MKVADIILQYGQVRFVRAGCYRYIRVRVSVLRDDGALVYKLYALYGGRIDRSEYVHRWEASHVNDVRSVALGVLKHGCTGRNTRSVMTMVLCYCSRAHGDRGRFASEMYKLIGASSIKLCALDVTDGMAIGGGGDGCGANEEE